MRGSTQQLVKTAYAAVQKTSHRFRMSSGSIKVAFLSPSASHVVQQRNGLMPGYQARVTISTLSQPSSTTCVLPSTLLDTLLPRRQQGSDHACQQQARQEGGRACSASNRGLIQHLAIASVTPEGSSDQSNTAAAAKRQHKQTPQRQSAAGTQVWQQVLELLQSLTARGPSPFSSSSAKAPADVAQRSSSAANLQQQLLEALQAVVADRTIPTAQQLLPLLTAAAAYHQQTPNPQLVSVLTLAAAAALPQLLPPQLPQVLLALHSLHGGRTAAAGSQIDSSTQDDTTAGTTSQADTLQDSSSQATAAQHGSNSSIYASPTLQHAGAGVNKAQQQHASAVTKAVRSYLQQQQGALDPSSIAAIAAACAATQQRGTFTILAMLVLDHVAHMTPGQLVTVAAAFAAVQHYNQTVCEAIAHQAAAILEQQGHKLQQQPAGAAAAADTLDQQQQNQQQNQQEVQEAARGFSADQLVTLLQAFARLRHCDAALLETGCTSLLRSPTRSLGLLSQLVHTCSLLNHFNLQLFETAVEMARGQMQQQQEQQQQEGQQQQQQQQQQGSRLLTQQLAQLSWGCGVMGQWQPDFVQQLCVWSADVDVKTLSTEELLQWHEVQASLTDAALLAPQASPTGLSSSLVVAAQAAWARRQQHRRLIGFQKEVVEALQQAGVRCRINVVLDGPVAVDVALVQPKVGARYRIALQLHPHEDFAANPPHGPLGPTAARWRALQARGWRVVTLQQSEWRRLKTKQQQVEYAWQLSQGVQVSAPGMPHLVHQVVLDNPKDDPRKKKSLPQVLLRILLEGH